MTLEDSKEPKRWNISPHWMLLVPVLLIAGALSAILTVANPPAGNAKISAGLGTPSFARDSDDAPEFNPPAFDAYHVEEAYSGDIDIGEID